MTIHYDRHGDLSYVHLACQLWPWWSGLDRSKVQGRTQAKKTLAEKDPDKIRRLEKICKAQTNPPYPEQWDEILDHTIRGFLGRQPHQRREVAISLPDLLIAPLFDVKEKHGAWHWILLGEALAGATTGESLTRDEREQALTRVRDRLWRPDSPDNPIQEVVRHLAALAAGPPQMGVRSLTILARLAQTAPAREEIRSLLTTSAPYFRLFRAMTKLMLDERRRSEYQSERERDLPIEDDSGSKGAGSRQVNAEDDEDEEAAKAEREHLREARQERQELAIALTGIEEPDNNPYPGRSLRWELLASVSDAEHFGERASMLALNRLAEVAMDGDRTWRERAYAAEVVTRGGDPRGALPQILASWEQDAQPVGGFQAPLAHAVAVLVERQLIGRTLKRAVGAKVDPKGGGAPETRVVRAARSANYPDWVVAAIAEDAQVGTSVEHAIKVLADQLTFDFYTLGTGAATSWTHIIGRLRFLCEEAVLPIAGSRRRRSVDCMSVAGLAGLASDVLLDALISPPDQPVVDPRAVGLAQIELAKHVQTKRRSGNKQAREAAEKARKAASDVLERERRGIQIERAPIWVQELAAWAVGFLHQPDEYHIRLAALAAAADEHLTSAEAIQRGTPLHTAHVNVAHAAIWAIGDAAGLRRHGRYAASGLAIPPLPNAGTRKPRSEQSKDEELREQAEEHAEAIRALLERALALPVGQGLDSVRRAAAYTMRYCLPHVRQLPISRDEVDPVVTSYNKLNLRWVRPPDSDNVLD